MKHMYRIGLVVVALCAPLLVLAMSPAQISQKINRFRTAIAEYKRLSGEGKGLTPRAQELKQEAERYIQEIKPFTTTKAFESELASITITAQAGAGKGAQNSFHNLVDFFGASQQRGTRTQKQALRTEGIKYFNDMATDVMDDGYKLLKQMYKSSEGFMTIQSDPLVKTSDRIIMLPIPTKGLMSPIEQIIYSSSSFGGMLYWVNKSMDRAYALLNMFGNPNNNITYGHAGLVDFISSTDTFLKNLNFTLGHLYGKKEDHRKLLRSEETVFSMLNRDLENYDLFIHQIVEEPNISKAIEKIQTFLEGAKLTYPEITDGKPTGQMITVTFDRKLGSDNTFFTVWKEIMDTLTGPFRDNWKAKTIYDTGSEHREVITNLEEKIELAKSELKLKVGTLELKLKAAEATQELLEQIEKLYVAIPEKDRPTKDQFTTEGLTKWIKANDPWFSGIRKEGPIRTFIKKLGLLALQNMDKINQLPGMGKIEIK